MFDGITPTCALMQPEAIMLSMNGILFFNTFLLLCIVSESHLSSCWLQIWKDTFIFKMSSLLEMKELSNYHTSISFRFHWKPTLITWPELEKKKEEVINSQHGIIKSCSGGRRSAWGIAACPHISYRGDISLSITMWNLRPDHLPGTNKRSS